jgi:predicted nucleic acid-binding Zn ribbon protein
MLPLPPRRIPPLGPPRLSPAQLVCAQWRGFDLSAQEKAQARTARPAAALLPRVLKDLRMDRRRTEAEILKVWNELLAPDVVAHAQPTGYRKGTVFVSVDSSGWLCEILRYRRKEILDRLRHSFGHEFIAKLSFRVG